MNRAEARRLKHATDKTYTLKQSDITKIKLDATSEAIDTALKLALALPILVLHDKFGFGEQRCKKLLDEVLKYHDSIVNGYVTLADIDKTVEEELKITINGGKK